MNKFAFSKESRFEIVGKRRLESYADFFGIVDVDAGKHNDITVFDFVFSYQKFGRSHNHCVERIGGGAIVFAVGCLIPRGGDDKVEFCVTGNFQILKRGKVVYCIIKKEFVSVIYFDIGVSRLNA